MKIKVKYILCNTYFFIDILSIRYSHNISNSLMFMPHLSMINVLLFHNWLKFHVGNLINSSGERFSWWSKSGLSVSFTIDIFALYSSDITSITWNLLSWYLWLLNIFSSVYLFRLVSCVTWDGVFKVWYEHIWFYNLFYNITIYEFILIV